MAKTTKNQKVTNKAVDVAIKTNDWTKEEAKDFLLKGGIVTTKVTNYDKDGNITHFCVTEKQVPPNYKLFLNPKEKVRTNRLGVLRDEMKK